VKINYPHYSKYKIVNVPWINEIPNHWEIRKLRSILDRVNEKNRPDLPLLSVVREKGVIKRSLSKNDDNHNVIPEDLSNHKVVKEGQFAMNKMKAWQGSYGVSKFDGVVSPAYYIFDIKSVEKDFFHVAIRSKAYVPFFNQTSDGVRVDQWDLSTDRMKNIPFFIPPLEEQNAIVRFLDYTDRRIKRYIRAKQKLIKLLEEEKQAIIHQAVTRGLNPDVPMKPSGVEWIGDIPEHWEIVRLRKTVQGQISGIWGIDPNGENEIICIRVADFDRRKRRINLSNQTIRSIEIRDQQKRILSNGDLLLEKSGGGDNQPVGNVMLFDLKVECVFSNFITKLSTTDSYDPYYLCYLHANLSNKKITVRSIKQTTGIQNLDLHSYLNELIPSPPLLEQNEIYRFLENKINKIDTIQDDYSLEISLLKEYRTRMIADVVTGKLDVRAAAALIPAELEEEPVEEEENEELIDEEVQEELES
jgi:type I restriction enzyme S subunit